MKQQTDAQRFQAALEGVQEAGKACLDALEGGEQMPIVMAMLRLDAAQKGLEIERHAMVACLVQCSQLDRLLDGEGGER